VRRRSFAAAFFLVEASIWNVYFLNEVQEMDDAFTPGKNKLTRLFIYMLAKSQHAWPSWKRSDNAPINKLEGPTTRPSGG
jgi:hypothetical protein